VVSRNRHRFLKSKQRGKPEVQRPFPPPLKGGVWFTIHHSSLLFRFFHNQLALHSPVPEAAEL
jgi:hypothetical protein